MKNKRIMLWIVTGAGLLVLNTAALGKMSRDESLLLFSEANQAFSKANESTDIQISQKLYEQAVLGYEKIIEQGGIKNSGLYYNLANAYLLNNDIGRAILNYRRAQRLDSSNPDIYKNLNYARNKRVDAISITSGKKVMERLFFWHYDFSMPTRFWFGGIAFTLGCLWFTIKLWYVKWPASRTVCGLLFLVAIAMVASITIERFTALKNKSGVILAESVVARQGDGNNYPESFKEPLHGGLEFDLIEQRPGWLHIQLANGHNAWIPDRCAELI